MCISKINSRSLSEANDYPLLEKKALPEGDMSPFFCYVIDGKNILNLPEHF
jgi:hypothetical protein